MTTRPKGRNVANASAVTCAITCVRCEPEPRGGRSGAAPEVQSPFPRAGVAQLVESELPKLKVAGSSPVARSKSFGSADESKGSKITC